MPCADQRRGRIEADAVVADLEANGMILEVDVHFDARGCACFKRVGQRFLRDAEQLELGLGLEARLRDDRDVDVLAEDPRNTSVCLTSVGTRPSAARSAGRSSNTIERTSAKALRARSLTFRISAAVPPALP